MKQVTEGRHRDVIDYFYAAVDSLVNSLDLFVVRQGRIARLVWRDNEALRKPVVKVS